MKTPIVKLGQATLDASAGVSWGLTIGTTPYMTIIQMDRKEAEKVIGNRGKAVDMTWIVDGMPTLTVNGVYIIGEAPSQDPFRIGIAIADRRIWWRRKHIFHRFNIRRRSGERRRLDADGETWTQTAPTVDDITYAPWSLRGEKRAWSARQVLETVLEELEPGNWEIRGQFSEKHVDHVELDSAAPAALGHALGMLAGAQCFVGLNGKVYVINRLDLQGVDALLGQLPPEMTIGTHPERVDQSASRPHRVSVLFGVEQEIRFDSTIAGDSRYANQGYEDKRWMQNVLPLPDATLTIGGKVKVQGTWVTFDEVLTAWAANMAGSGAPQLTDTLIRKWWHTDWMEAMYGALGEISPNANWAARIAAVRAHYRQTYRINKRWMSRIFSLRPYRVGILDTETGTFAPSTVYAPYTIISNFKSWGTALIQQHIMRSFDGSASEDQAVSSNSRSSPAVVQIMDPELGIIHFSYRTDLQGGWKQILPGAVEHLGKVDVSRTGEAVTIDGSTYGRGGYGVGLTSDHRVNVFLTAVPAAPNNLDNLHREIVQPSDVGEHLPAGAGSIGACGGPEWFLRVGGQLATARYAWKHSMRKDIERSFGVDTDPDKAGNRDALVDLLQNKNEIQDLARVIAAGLYASMPDRVEGQRLAPLTPSIEPAGSINAVNHALRPDGVALTEIVMAPEMQSYDPMATLPASARRLFLRETQP